MAALALNDEVLGELMRGVPYRGVVLFEDIDAAFTPNGSEDGSESESEEESAKGNRGRENLGNGVTFSGLLNVLVLIRCSHVYITPVRLTRTIH